MVSCSSFKQQAQICHISSVCSLSHHRWPQVEKYPSSGQRDHRWTLLLCIAKKKNNNNTVLRVKMCFQSQNVVKNGFWNVNVIFVAVCFGSESLIVKAITFQQCPPSWYKCPQACIIHQPHFLKQRYTPASYFFNINITPWNVKKMSRGATVIQHLCLFKVNSNGDATENTTLCAEITKSAFWSPASTSILSRNQIVNLLQK